VALAYNPTIVSSGLVVAYDPANPKCYPGSGVTFYDLSGNNNHGILTNGPTISNNLAKYTVFDGGNDFIVSVNNTNITGTNPRTIMAWAWMGNVSTSVIARIGASADNQAFEMQINAGRLIMHRYGGTPSFVSTSAIVSQNRWYHFAIAYDGTDHKFYVDGQYITAAGLAITTPNSVLYVGYPVYSGNGHMNGNVSQTLLYNRELSATEINQNYNATKGRYAYTADIVTNGLVSAFDAGSALSYPGSGSRIYNVTSAAGATADLRNGPTIVGSGSTAYIDISGSSTRVLEFSSNSFRSISFAMWISSSQSGGSYYIIDCRPSFTNYFYVTNSGFFTKLYVNGVKSPLVGLDNTTVFPRNQWLHVYCELPANNTGSIFFGNRFSFDEPITARLAYVNFYNRALEPFEIQQNYDAMRGRYS
jgi:hypothetical protein